jgi:hypothetical protein
MHYLNNCEALKQMFEKMKQESWGRECGDSETANHALIEMEKCECGCGLYGGCRKKCEIEEAAVLENQKGE